MSSIESIFTKNKKKKKGNRALALDDATSKSRSSADSALTSEVSILGGGGGWVNDVGKKKVYTGGKKVAELINMNDLMTADEAAAERVYQQEQRREFTESRAAKEMQSSAQEEAKRVVGEDKTGKTEPKESGERGLSSLGGLRWKDRLAQKEMNKRMAQLDVNNMEAFPSLGPAAETTQANASLVWVGETGATNTKQDDDSNGLGNQNSVVGALDEVIDNGLSHEGKGADVTQSETAPETAPETTPGLIEEPFLTAAKTLTPDGGTIEEPQQLSSLDLLAKANKKIKKKKKKDAGQAPPQPTQ